MPLFRRNGEPADVPDVHSHENVLTQRRNDVETQARDLRTRIAQLEADKADAFLEGRIEDGTAAVEQLEVARAELVRLDATAAALFEAQQEVNRERQKIDMQTRIEECERLRDEAAERCRQIMADLPICIAEAQQLARAAQQAEAEHADAHRTIKGLQHHLAHFGEPQYDSIPRIHVPSPLGAEWGRHPEYQMLANGNWFVGVAGGPGPR